MVWNQQPAINDLFAQNGPGATWLDYGQIYFLND